MDGWIILTVIIVFILWIMGVFDSEEEKARNLERRQLKCKHKFEYGELDKYDWYDVHCKKCGYKTRFKLD